MSNPISPKTKQRKIPTPEQKARDRKDLHRKAASWHRKGRSADSFKSMIRSNWPTVFDRISDKEFDHLVAFVWNLKL